MENYVDNLPKNKKYLSLISLIIEEIEWEADDEFIEEILIASQGKLEIIEEEIFHYMVLTGFTINEIIEGTINNLRDTLEECPNMGEIDKIVLVNDVLIGTIFENLRQTNLKRMAKKLPNLLIDCRRIEEICKAKKRLWRTIIEKKYPYDDKLNSMSVEELLNEVAQPIRV